MRRFFTSFVTFPVLLSAVLASEVSESNYVGTDAIQQVATIWKGTTPRDLHNEYHNIFRHGNRNAASHLWSTFILERSAQMSPSRLESLFAGFCAVSGSPVWPSDYNRYRLNLNTVTGGKRSGYMHYCCWPCVCDTQDFIRVDTKTVLTADGPKKYHFAVLGNPCDHPEKLREPFVQPFSWGRETTLEQDAPEVRCQGGRLLGATMSDHGFVIISLFFDIEGDPANAPPVNETGAAALVPVAPQEEDWGPPQPGRVRRVAGVLVQDEYEWAGHCADRARNGYNSGMGEIFRRVAAISPVPVPGSAPPAGPAIGPPSPDIPPSADAAAAAAAAAVSV